MRFARLADLAALVGQPLGTSDWLMVDQARIDAFAEATDDRQWIHVDRERAAAGPWGTPIAHGFLTLSLLPAMFESALQVDDQRVGINYGLDRVRFPAALPAGTRVRGHLRLLDFQPVAGGAQLAIEVTVEAEGLDRPVCVAASLTRRLT